MRYVTRVNQEDEEEAQQLLRELLSSTDLGSKVHSIAIDQLGIIAIARFNNISSMEDLDEALIYCKMDFNSCVEGDDGRLEMLQQIVNFYTKRFEYTYNLEDMDIVIQYSCLLFESIPVNRSSRGESLLERLQRIRRCAFARRSSEVCESAIELSQAAFAQMPETYENKEQSQLIFTHLLSQHYILSNQLEDLLVLVEYTASMIAGYHARIGSGFAKQNVHADWTWDSVRTLKKLAAATVEISMRQLAEEELLGAFLSCFHIDSKQYGPPMLETIHTESEKRLEVLTAAAEANITLSDDQFELEITRVKGKWRVGDIEFLKSLFEHTPKHFPRITTPKKAVNLSDLHPKTLKPLGYLIPKHIPLSLVNAQSLITYLLSVASVRLPVELYFKVPHHNHDNIDATFLGLMDSSGLKSYFHQAVFQCTHSLRYEARNPYNAMAAQLIAQNSEKISETVRLTLAKYLTQIPGYRLYERYYTEHQPSRMTDDLEERFYLT